MYFIMYGVVLEENVRKNVIYALNVIMHGLKIISAVAIVTAAVKTVIMTIALTTIVMTVRIMNQQKRNND